MILHHNLCIIFNANYLLRGDKVPLVSIIIPTYNRERMIGKTIQSVLNQTNQDFEIIVVDDGSEDATKEVVDSFHSDKIQYYYQQNQGEFQEKLCRKA